MNEADEVLKRIDYPGFYRKHIPGFNPDGRKEVLSLCPFHEDNEPSFSVNMETGLYFCHACGEKGNALQFLQRKDGIDFKEALQRLKAGEGITTDTTPPPKAAKKAPASPPKKSSFLNVDQISTLHRQLTKNEKVLKLFMSKYGLDLPTIEKYLIGYQNERFVIPIEIEPGKWTFKEHKGSQLKGSQVSLYPSAVIKEGLPYIVIAEGEFKALLLNQHGFLAVSGTGGANTWKREWSPLFQGLNVIMAYDNDEPGRQGAQRVAESLSGTAKSVKAIQWPAMLDGSKDKKDLTDFFVTLGKTREDFQRLIDGAQEIGRPIKELDGYRFVEPEGFQVEAGRMLNTCYVKDMIIRRVFFYAPVLITGRAIDIDDGTEEVDLTFKQRRKWRSLWTSKRNISDVRKIIEFSDYGLAVDSNNAKKLVEYLSAFDALNADLIPNTFIARSTGWKTIQDKYLFVMNRTVSKGAKRRQAAEGQTMAIDFRPDIEFERFVRAMRSEGTYPKWREAVTETLQFPYAAFAFYASFASPLLRIFNAPSFIIHFWGNTSTGKTTVLELASSIWGDPHKENGGLVFGWDSTPVFLERMAAFFCDMPIFPDDSQNVDDRKMNRMLYQLANGAGKGRGSITAIQKLKSWRTIVFSTGERKLTDCTTFGGAQARTLELYGSPFANAKGVFISELKQAIRENYGHAGPKFIEGLLSIIEKPNELTGLKAEFKRFHQLLSREAGSEIGDRLSQYFAVVKIAADLVHRILGIGDPVDVDEAIHRVFNIVQEDAQAYGDMPTRAMHDILSWVSANIGYFKESDREQYGRIAEYEYIGIFRRTLREVLKKDGYSEMAVLRGWAERDWIKREDADHYDCPRRVRSGGILENIRLVIIPWKVFQKFTAGAEDDS
jgi:uncharacterized protein (DUF927 family)